VVATAEPISAASFSGGAPADATGAAPGVSAGVATPAFSTPGGSAEPAAPVTFLAAPEDCTALPQEVRENAVDGTSDGCRANLGVSSACVEEFWRRVQHVFAERDVQALAALTDGDFRVNIRVGKHRKIKPSNSKRLAGRLFTEKIRARMAHADPKDTLCNYQGTMIDNGLFWANVSESDGQLRLRVLNE
jgi:hypothetical protein